MMNLPDVFAERSVAAFVRDICDLSKGEPQVVIHMLVCDEEVIAIFAGTEDGRRFSMMFNTYTLSDNAKYSPGLILIRHILEYYARRNYSSLDLGIGGDHYKTMFCKDMEELFDSFIPLTARPADRARPVIPQPREIRGEAQRDADASPTPFARS